MSAEKVQHVIQDIVTTEEAYVNNLTVLKEAFIKPVKVLRANGQIEGTKVTKMFGNVEAIYNFHVTFLADLRAQYEQSADDANAIAGVFNQYVDFLKMYTTYVNSYGRCCDVVGSLRSHKKFQNVLRAARRDKRTKGNDLMTFLIMPVQRIPMYEVLLERLLRSHEAKRLEEQGVSSRSETTRLRARRPSVTVSQIEQSLIRVKEVAVYVNENKRGAEAQSKLIGVASRIRLSGGDGLVLVTPTRYLIREGELHKLGSFGFKKRVFVFLFNDLLLWTNSAHKALGRIELAHAVLSDPSAEVENASRGNTKKTNAELPTYLDIIHPKSLKPIKFLAASAEECSEWLNDLNNAIKLAAAKEFDINLRRTSVTESHVAHVKQEVAGFLAGKTSMAEFMDVAAQVQNPSALVDGDGDQTPSTVVDGEEEAKCEDRDVTSALDSVLDETFQQTAVVNLEDSLRSLYELTPDDLRSLVPGINDSEDDDDGDGDDELEPAVAVKNILEAVCVVLGVEPVPPSRGLGKPSLWLAARRLVQKEHFAKLIKGHSQKRMRISMDGMRLLKRYVTNPLLEPAAVSKVPHTALILWNWVRANYSAQSGMQLELLLQDVIDSSAGGDDDLSEISQPSQSVPNKLERKLQLPDGPSRKAKGKKKKKQKKAKPNPKLGACKRSRSMKALRRQRGPQSARSHRPKQLRNANMAVFE